MKNLFYKNALGPKRKAIFVDKDGTLVVDVPYNVTLSKIVFAEGMLDCLRVLQQSGYLIIIVSNQSGLARGYFTESQLQNAVVHIAKLMEDSGVTLDGFYFCPHHPHGIVEQYAMECCCRKPLPGLFTCASAEMNIELKNSWMIGNSIVDVKAGTAAGCSTVLLESMGKDNKESSTIEASMTLRDVRELLTMILSQSADFYKRN